MPSTDFSLLRRLEPNDEFFAAIASHGDEIVPVGPFRAIIDPALDALWASSAVPAGDLGSDTEALEFLGALRQAFESRRRIPQIEFNEPYWPRLPALLRQAGFAETEREPLMVCTPESFRPHTNPDVEVRFLQPEDPDADLVAYQTIFSAVLVNGGWRPTPRAMAHIRGEVELVRGRSHALAKRVGEAVGTGFISSTEGVAEIARVATLPHVRGRGVAATLTSFMLRDRFAAGDGLAWLSAADTAAQALYEKLGFWRLGDRVHYVAKH